MQRPDCADRGLPPGTQIVDVFDEVDRALLILGAPGAGKTMLLLTLAQHLLDRAAQDPVQPIPVIFPLSSWATRRRPLADWLVEALSEQYQVPRKTGQTWVDADHILPLLDGLDEVASEHRAACVEAINTFRQDHGLLPLVVCSRMTDYEDVGTPLRLQGAIVVQSLTRTQVDSYVAQVGPPLAAVRQPLQDDPMLWELLDTPLMLTIVTLAYAGQPVEALRTHGTPVARRQSLFAAYVNRMFQRRSTVTRYTRQQTERWLAWLAWQLAQQSRTVFYLERLQPDWLSVGLSVGLLAGLGSGASTFLTDIRPVETIPWSWSAFRSGWSILLGVLLYLVLLIGLVDGLRGDPLRVSLVDGLSYGVLGGLGYGGLACLQHFILRLLLVRQGTAPWRYADFLDYATERLFLRKVGGGYIFIHRLVQEYFATKFQSGCVDSLPRVPPTAP